MGLYITLNSNGTLINEEYADLLAKHLPRRINITLYGSSDEIYGELCGNPNGFSQTMKAIQLLKERNVPVKLNGSLTPQNEGDLENIQRIAREIEIPLEVTSYMFPSARKGICEYDYAARLTPEKAAKGLVKIQKEELAEEEFEELAQAMSRCYHESRDYRGLVKKEPLSCRAGRSSFWVTWQGIMTPCVFMDKPGTDVFEVGFEKAWEVVKAGRDKMFMPKACTKCGMRTFCDVCGACAYTETGRTDKKPEYMCAMTKEKLRLMAEYVEKNDK